MKQLIILATLCFIVTSLAADEWAISTDMSFTLNQNAYSDNWQGEEIGNITWVFNSHTRANKTLSDLFMWRNNLRLAFGQTHQQETIAGEKTWLKPTKSTDNIDFDSMLRMTFNRFVDPFVAFRWESQFLDLSDPNETMMINPMRFTESAGVAKDFIDMENHILSSRLGVAFRQFYDRRLDDDSVTYDGGIESITEHHRRFVERGISFDSRLLLYQALYYSEEDVVNDDWKALDVTWENSLTAKLWSVINLVFNFDLIYDKEQHHKGQFRQHLGLGIVWQL